MGKLNKALREKLAHSPAPLAAVRTAQPTAPVTNHQGGTGYGYDVKSETFLTGATTFVGENTGYEGKEERLERFILRVRQAVVEDPQWTANFLGWLRVGGNMRTISLIGAVEAARELAAFNAQRRAAAISRAVRAEIDAGMQPRKLLLDAVGRADEPGEVLAYWLAHYGRPLPKWLTWALGDLALKFYTEFTWLKWDSDRNPVRFADVIEMSQTDRDAANAKTELFRFILDARHGNVVREHPGLRMVAANAAAREALVAGAEFDAEMLRAAGLQWQVVLSLLGNVRPKKDLWEALAPTMGYTALLKNLRNFDRAGICVASRAVVAARLCAPDAVAASRCLPQEFYTAYVHVRDDFWKSVLDTAATSALRNVPFFDGRTLVLIDTSSSMNVSYVQRDPKWAKSRQWEEPEDELTRWQVATLFGLALARRSAACDVVSFSGGGYGTPLKEFNLLKGENLLAAVTRFRQTHYLGGGTDIHGAIRATIRKEHSRVVLLTDEQDGGFNGSWVGAYGRSRQPLPDIWAPVPASVPCFTFNLAGFQFAAAPSGPNRYTVGGLSDAGFVMMKAVEGRQRDALWPWERAMAAG